MRSTTRAKSEAVAGTARLYTAFGKIIESDLYLPQLSGARRGAPSVTIRGHRGDALGQDAGQTVTVHEVVDSAGDVFYRLERRNGQYLWWYPEAGHFAVARDGRSISWAAEDAKRADAAAVLTGPVLGFALQLQGQISLHGSAVVIDGSAIGLVAPSRFGKSTMAASLMTKGCQLLTDGIIALEARSGRMRVLPSSPRLKLWPGTLEGLLRHMEWREFPRLASWLEKRVVRAGDVGDVCRSARPLAALFLLAPAAPDSEIEVQPLRAREALLALVSQGYNAHLLALEPELQASQLELFGQIVQVTPVYVIRYPWTFERLGEVADAILAYGRAASESRGVL